MWTVAARSRPNSPAGAAAGRNLGRMPSPKRADLDDYYAQLPHVAVPHLTKLRELCQQGLPKADEVLHWNNPAFVQDGTRARDAPVLQAALLAAVPDSSLRFADARQSKQLATRRARASSSSPTTATCPLPCSSSSSRHDLMSSRPSAPAGSTADPSRVPLPSSWRSASRRRRGHLWCCRCWLSRTAWRV